MINDSMMGLISSNDQNDITHCRALLEKRWRQKIVKDCNEENFSEKFKNCLASFRRLLNVHRTNYFQIILPNRESRILSIRELKVMLHGTIRNDYLAQHRVSMFVATPYFAKMIVANRPV